MKNRSTEFSRLFGPTWYNFLEEYLNSKSFNRLLNIELKLRDKYIHYPELSKVFRAFQQTPLDTLKVIFVAQDPYHNGSATGLCMGVEPGGKLPPTLANLFKELSLSVFPIPSDKGNWIRYDPTLESWANQGVLLLNRALSVRKSSPESNLIYWRPFTDYVIQKLSEQKKDLIFVLLGRKAQEVGSIIDHENHDVIYAAHPAAENYRIDAGFFGSDIFIKINHLIEDTGERPIKWVIYK